MEDTRFLKAVVVDESLTDINLLKDILSFKYPLVSVIGHAHTIEDAFTILNSKRPDIVFIETFINGISTFKFLKSFKNYLPQIVFTTKNNKHAVDAIRIGAIDYLLKPIDSNELHFALNRCYKRILNQYSTTDLFHISNQSKRILLHTKDIIHIIKLEDIVRCEADINYTTFYLMNKKTLFISKTLKEYEEILMKYDFVRVQRKHLINLQYVSFYNKKNEIIHMMDGSSIPVSIRKRENLFSMIHLNS